MKEGKRRRSVPIRVVNSHVFPQKLLLSRLVRQVPPDLVAVLLGLEERDEVDARPHLLAGELAGGYCEHTTGHGWVAVEGKTENILLLADADNQLVPAKEHQDGAAGDERARAEQAARGEVAL
jgi:hypothetical protein